MPFQPDTNTALTVRIWSNMGQAIKKGASWGDLSVFTRIEMDDILAARQGRSVTSMPILTGTNEATYIERSEPSAPACEESELPIQVKPIQAKPTSAKKTTAHKFSTTPRPMCLGCRTFCIHSKPPESWSAGDRKRYCCLGCRDSTGKKHSDRCQKHK
jgi:hypothetical protein